MIGLDLDKIALYRNPNRDIRGDLRFNGDDSKTMRGSDGLISFEVEQNAMGEERFRIGATNAACFTANFYNTGVPQGVVLENCFVDAFVGVATGTPASASDDYNTETSVNLELNKQGAAVEIGITGDGGKLNKFFSAIPNNSTVHLSIDRNGSNKEELDATMVYTESGGLIPTIDKTTEFVGQHATYKLYIHNLRFYFDAYNGSTSYNGNFHIQLTAQQPQVSYAPHLGRFYITSVEKGKETTAITGYDIVSKLNVKYTPNIEYEEDRTNYSAYQVLNDIIDQTGVDDGDPVSGWLQPYVQAVNDGTMKDQWEWIHQLDVENPGHICRASRTWEGHIEEVSIADGELNYDDYPALDDTVIYENGLELKDTFTIEYLTAGTNDETRTYGDNTGEGLSFFNPYWILNDTGSPNTRGQIIFNSIDGVSYTPMKVRFRGDPYLEVMDSIKVEQGENTYKCIIMYIKSTFNGGFEQTIECYGEPKENEEISQGAISTKVDAITDYVRESGSISYEGNTWYYRKWNSGYMELWCRIARTMNFQTAWGSLYSATFPRLNYPFSFRPNTQPLELTAPVGAKADTDSQCLICNAGLGTGATESQTGQYLAIRPTSGTAQVRILYYVRGLL